MAFDSARIAVLTSALLLALAGCSTLLPSGKVQEPLPWASYQEASGAIERIVPYESTRQSLRELGIDPSANPAISILNYSDLLQRFAAVSAVPASELERGIGDCLRAGRRCTGYSLSVRQLQTRRIGNFWLDVFNFRRDTLTTGWSFSALVVFVDDVVVYALPGGQPKIEEEQDTRNPLGPLQGLGESLRPSVGF